MDVAPEVRVAHASRVLVEASRLNGLSLGTGAAKVRERGTHSPAPETGALPSGCGPRAFTIVEILVVMTIILILAGLILATSSYVHNKGARSRAEAEIAAMSAALENYKADSGVYPSNSTTDNLTPSSTIDPNASLYLYKELSGDHNADRAVNDSDKTVDSNGNPISPPLTSLPKSYFTFKDNMLLPPPPSTAAVTAIRDPFGNSYGYSTKKLYNPTFDLWSTANSTDPVHWIKNW